MSYFSKPLFNFPQLPSTISFVHDNFHTSFTQKMSQEQDARISKSGLQEGNAVIFVFLQPWKREHICLFFTYIGLYLVQNLKKKIQCQKYQQKLQLFMSSNKEINETLKLVSHLPVLKLALLFFDIGIIQLFFQKQYTVQSALQACE